jgi:hypothetical protein
MNKRESFDDISRNILIDKSLTNVHGKTLIELANDNLQKSTLGYMNEMYTEFTSYPIFQQELEKEKINYTEKQSQYAIKMYDLSSVRLTLTDLSANIGKCIQKYYTNGNGTPEADPKDFSMFQTSKYPEITHSGLIALLNRLRQSFARTMNAINIHNYNIERAQSGGLAKMRMDIFNSLIGKYAISETAPNVSCCNINRTVTTNYSALTSSSAIRASKYSMNDTYKYKSLSFKQFDKQTYNNYNGHDQWTVLYTGYSIPSNDTTAGNPGGSDLTSPWPNARFNNDDKLYGRILAEQNRGHNWLYANNTNRNMFSKFGMETTFVSLLDKYMNMKKWMDGSILPITDTLFTNDPNLLNIPVVITTTNYKTISYYNKISINTKVFEDLILKYNTVIYDDLISLNMNVTPISYTDWLSTYYYKNRVISWTEQANIDHNGNDLGNGTGSLEEAKARCENSVPECKGFNWNPVTKLYWFKHTLGASGPLQGHNFYTKVKQEPSNKTVLV